MPELISVIQLYSNIVNGNIVGEGLLFETVWHFNVWMICSDKSSVFVLLVVVLDVVFADFFLTVFLVMISPLYLKVSDKCSVLYIDATHWSANLHLVSPTQVRIDNQSVARRDTCLPAHAQ